MKSRSIAVIAMSVAAAAATPASAHHSRAMFDMTKTVSVTGTVKELQWTNPHIWLELIVADAKGQVQQWSLEGSAPVILIRRGWRPTSLKSGDVVTVQVHPLRSGAPGGELGSVKRADGTTIGETSRAD